MPKDASSEPPGVNCATMISSLEPGAVDATTAATSIDPPDWTAMSGWKFASAL